MKKYRSHWIVLGLYTLLTLILTWPWIAHFTGAFLGTATWAFDESTFVWNIWRFKHNLLDLGQSPLHTTDIFYPLGISLVLYTYNFLNALLGLPLLMSFSLPVAGNVTILLAYVLSGYGAYLLIRYLLADQNAGLPGQLAAFIGGAIYAFLASRAVFAALGHYDVVTTEFIPFFALFFIRTLRRPGYANPVLAGIFAALCLLAEMIFGVFLLFLGLILLSHHLINKKVRGDTPPSPRPAALFELLLKLLVLGIVAAVLWSPAMLPILRAFTQADYALSGWGEGLKLSADLLGWFTPTALHPLWGTDWVTRLHEVQAGTAPFLDVNTVFLGYGITALAILGAVTFRRQVGAWISAAVIFAVFTLGPLLQIGGKYLFPLDNLLREQCVAQDVTFPLPFALLHYLPIIKANRVPTRFAVVLGLALAVLAAYGAFWALRKVQGSRFKVQGLRFKVQGSRFKVQGSRAEAQGLRVKGEMLVVTAALLTGVVLFDQLALPMPLTSAEVPDVYAKIGAESGQFSLLQLPLGWRNSFGVYGAERTQIQYYQTIHQKPMLGGNISRAPAFKFDYYKNIPLFQAIAQTELPQSDPPVSAETLEKARGQAGELMTLYNVGYVVIHPPIPQRKPYEDTFTATRQLVFDLLPLAAEPTYTSDGVAAYKVNQPPVADPLRLDFGDWRSWPYRGEGWASDELFEGASVNWATGAEALIFFPYHGQGERRLAMHVKPFGYPNAPAQTLTIRLNERTIGAYPLAEDWQVIETALPAESLQTGLNRLELGFSRRAAPREVLPAQTAIGSTDVTAPVDIEINSHADFSFVTVGFGDNAQDASAHRRGFNVTVLDPHTGKVLAVKGFDTAANVYEAEALTAFLDQIPAGRIVLVSSQGAEAAAFVSAGFTTLGGSANAPLAPYSLIGVKGAAPGSALEASGQAYLRLGKNPDTRSLAAAVDWVEIKK